MTGKGSGKRGRRRGFKLSEASKRAISDSKKGQRHSKATKDKISKSLVAYFKKQNPLSSEISSKYSSMGIVFKDWLDDIRFDLDSSSDIITDRGLRNKLKTEITCGDVIEYFSHDMNPELILLFKEYCLNFNIDPEDVLDDIY